MRTIFKYKLELEEEQIIQIKAGAQVLKVDTQGGEIMLWAVVDSDAAEESRRVILCGTGNPLRDACGPGNYVGTVFLEYLVFHIFVAPRGW